jgi:hypothetical protein
MSEIVSITTTTLYSNGNRVTVIEGERKTVEYMYSQDGKAVNDIVVYFWNHNDWVVAYIYTHDGGFYSYI